MGKTEFGYLFTLGGIPRWAMRGGHGRSPTCTGCLSPLPGARTCAGLTLSLWKYIKGIPVSNHDYHFATPFSQIGPLCNS